MANIKYSDLIRDVLPFLASDPSDPFTETVIKRAAIEFCRESWVWKHVTEAEDVTVGEDTYDIDIPNGSAVAMVMDVGLNGVPLEAKQVDWLNINVPTWRTNASTPKYYTQTEPGQIMLAPTPSENTAGALVITVALQPARSATGFPEWISNKFPYAITDGALAKLMLVPGKPWTDLAGGADRRVLFDAAIANARAMAASGLGRAPIRSSTQH